MSQLILPNHVADCKPPTVHLKSRTGKSIAGAAWSSCYRSSCVQLYVQPDGLSEQCLYEMSKLSSPPVLEKKCSFTESEELSWWFPCSCMFRIGIFKVCLSWMLIIGKLMLGGTNLLGHESNGNLLVGWLCVCGKRPLVCGWMCGS